MTRRKDGAENKISVSRPIDLQQTSHVECDRQTGIYSGLHEFLALATTPRVRRSPTRLRGCLGATRRMPQNPRIVKSNNDGGNTKPKLALDTNLNNSNNSKTSHHQLEHIMRFTFYWIREIQLDFLVCLKLGSQFYCFLACFMMRLYKIRKL